MGWYTKHYNADYWTEESSQPVFFSFTPGEVSAAVLMLQDHGVHAIQRVAVMEDVRVDVPPGEGARGDKDEWDMVWFVEVHSDDADMAVGILATEEYFSWE